MIARRRGSESLLVGALVASLLVTGTRPASAAPVNDDFADATVVPDPLPFTDTVDTFLATTELGEPDPPCGSSFQNGHTVWYRYTPPADAGLVADTFGSRYDTVLTVYTGADLGSLQPVTCNDQANGTNQSEVTFAAAGGETYHFQVAGFFAASGTLVFNLVEPLVGPAPGGPANDEFAAAAVVPEPLPYAATIDLATATLEAGEPQPSCGAVDHTAWYRFTPGVDVSVAAHALGAGFPTVVAAYTGADFSALTERSCSYDRRWRSSRAGAVFTALAGQTYHVQVGAAGDAVGAVAVDLRVFPPDVDDPPGLAGRLASDPGRGFRSHSEPHVAQSPLDPDVLVAASKMYNLDPDSLAEYEFKIGTYVSFDGGLTWTDLGQLAVCPAAQAPPESWPNNTCYPQEDPARDGPEGTRGGGGDWAEEYITSDAWVQFDDEGNAYVMVLDAPPRLGGGGWGMTLHRWDTVSPHDLVTGQTWSPRLPINAYGDPARPFLFLDDKNTFAVNNAGPDGDGHTGILVACWGQVVAFAKQQIVCERSTDGGRTWPLPPVPVSDVQHFVVGVVVVADPHDPLTFYAVWHQGIPPTMEFARTIDGGLTWVRNPLPVAFVRGIPRQFPGHRFRNISIPTMAAGPVDGALYLAWSDYGAGNADILLTSSGDGGLTWSETVNLTADTGPGTDPQAHQFQPAVAVTPSGQVNVAYFDNRFHPDYFDVYLSRSNDGGQTFAEVRVSHDGTDAEHHAPVSSSGLFFGDYQGLVADDCFAVPFFNVTHLALGNGRDPEFTAGLPFSDYQEVFAWRVPNTPAFAGTGGGCP